MSCNQTEHLQCNIFALPNLKLRIDNACNIGDIIRCQKFYLQYFNGKIQGVGSPNGNWTICQHAPYELNHQNAKWTFVNNKTVFNDDDFLILMNFIYWRSTNPISQLILNSCLFDYSKINPSKSNNQYHILKFYLTDLPLVRISDLKEGFQNIICQVIIVKYTMIAVH